MKYSKALWITSFFCFVISFLSAQSLNGSSSAGIHSFRIVVATNKTTNLLFPFSIKSVDRGSSDILAQKAPGTENVLQLKAAKPGFDQTNLSVITADGDLYSFLIDYDKNPDVLNFSFDKNYISESPSVNKEPVRFTDSSMNEKQLQISSRVVLQQGNNVHGLKDHNYEVKLKITGIYVKNERMFFKILVKNKSEIDYDIDNIRFLIRDQKRIKRSASQELEIVQVYSTGKPNIIKGGSRQTFVIVLPKFTIPDQKYFITEMMEKNGGRFLHVIIHNSDLMKSKLI